MQGFVKMTKAHALRIQAEQIAFYERLYGPHVRGLVEAKTRAHMLDDGREYSVVEINRYIPRGGHIEALIPEKVASEAAAKERGRLARLEENK